DNGKGEKTKVHVKVKNTGNIPASFNIREDVKGYADNWIWDDGRWCDGGTVNPFNFGPHCAKNIGSMNVYPGEIRA
ncbi:MAG: hypothetical protein LBP35_03625, partial [Candidatus Ancillula trichonymphae]|nr:hypothetical protein [Candidatus Ancillula trichonymphae]